MAKRYWMSVCALSLGASAVLFEVNSQFSQVRRKSFCARDASARKCAATRQSAAGAASRPFSIPLAFEPAVQAKGGGPQFIGRGTNLDVALTRKGIDVAAKSATRSVVAVASLRFIQRRGDSRSGGLSWHGVGTPSGETNYLLENDPATWRTHVPRFARVETAGGRMGISVYAHEREVEYDLRVPPGANASEIRLAVAGGRDMRLDAQGNLLMRVGQAELRMNKPVVYEEAGFSPASWDSAAAMLGIEGASASRFRTRTRGRRFGSRGSFRRSGSRRSRSVRRYSTRSRTKSYGASPQRSPRPHSDRYKLRRENRHPRQNWTRQRRARHRRAQRSRRSRRARKRSERRRSSARTGSAGAEGARKTRPPSREMRHPLEARYVLEADGTIGFRVARRDPRATLVIDPTISLAYASFLGGMGSETANSIATDAAGKIYVAGTTTSPTTFPEAAATQLGPGLPANSGTSGGVRQFFVAKLDPTQGGAGSLVYLTFLGGSADQVGGLIAVDSAGDVVITGTTTSADFPVTDASARTSGANDVTVSKLDPTGSVLLYSTLFGGNGVESSQTAGGVALDASGRIFVASDTDSTNLPVTAGAYSSVYTSPVTDGFVAVFQPGSLPALKYCSYLGLNGQIGVGGVALDASGNVYLAGFTSDPNADFPLKNAAQPFFGGGAFDAFLMKLAPGGNGAADLAYATLLGGNGSDQAFAVAVDSANPPNAYVTGTTGSTNFPTNGTVAAYQTMLPSNATAATSEAFVSVIAQDATTGLTSLAYSTYLGGSQKDTGFGIAAAHRYAVYVTGTANSWDFPWHDNFQPFNGYGNAFVAKLDTTTPGAGSLIYSTPLGGTSPAGVKAGTQGSAIATDASGNVWVTGQTTSLDFASAGNPGNGFQQICGSCQESPPASDAFVAEIQENALQQLPSLYFAGPGIPLNFGTQAIGATNIPPQFAAIKNGGEAPLVISSMAITGPNSSDFSLMNAGTCTTTSIAPGGMCSFEVGFVPSMAGAELAFVQADSNAPGSPQVLEVIGIGAGLAAPPGGINFGQQIVGTTSAPRSVTLTNTSTMTPVYLDSVVEAGPNAIMFVPASTAQQCVAIGAAGIPPSGSCLVAMTFAPTSTGTFAAEVDIQYHLSGEPEQSQTVPLTGIGVAAAPVAALLPTALDFGSVTTGTTTGIQIVTLTNTGSAALNVTAISLTGANAGDFAIVAAGSTPCPATSGSVAINASCTIGVQFAPQTAGTKSAALSFADNAASSPQTVALTGTAQTPAAIQITPASLTFAAQAVGTASGAQQVSISNPGGNTLAVNGISLVGTNAADFSETTNCPPSLAPNANCAVSVVFQPAAPGTISASLRIADNAANSPQDVALNASATQPAVVLSTPSINFGNQAVGTPSAAVSVTVTNSGNGPLVLSGISLGGANAGDFTETDNCSGSAAPNGIAPSANCAIQIIFRPACGTATALRSATLSLADNAPGSPQTIALNGTGTGVFCFLVPSGSSLSSSVSPGQTGSFALQLEAANGFTGTVGLTCAGAPSASTCTIAPGTIDIGGNQISAFQVNVATSSGGAAAVLRGPRRFVVGRGAEATWAAELALCSFLIALACAAEIKRQRSAREEGSPRGFKGRPVRRFAILAGATFLVVMSLGACGGGSAPASAPSDPATPAGTYSIIVTGTTSSGASQSMTLSLIVQ